MKCPNCEPWPVPPECCKEQCDTQAGRDLFDLWWPAVCEWLYQVTCSQFGCCDVEVAPCPPLCACVNVCRCGPWQSIDLRRAFGGCPLKVVDGVPQIEFRFPQPGGTVDVVPWTAGGVFSIRPDMLTVDWCEPLDPCGGWPSNTECVTPWTIAASVGQDPPAMLVQSAGRFVCEIVKDCLGQDSCLPDGVTRITRRGTSMDVERAGFQETAISFDTNNTGVPLLDMALRQWGCESLTPSFALIDPIGRRDAARGARTRGSWTFRPLWPARPIGSV